MPGPVCSYHHEFEAYVLSSRHLCFRALFTDRKSVFTLQRLFPATSFTKGGTRPEQGAALPRPAAQETHPTATATRVSGPAVRRPAHLGPSCLSRVTRRLFRAQPEGELGAASIAAEEAASAAGTPLCLPSEPTRAFCRGQASRRRDAGEDTGPHRRLAAPGPQQGPGGAPQIGRRPSRLRHKKATGLARPRGEKPLPPPRHWTWHHKKDAKTERRRGVPVPPAHKNRSLHTAATPAGEKQKPRHGTTTTKK